MLQLSGDHIHISRTSFLFLFFEDVWHHYNPSNVALGCTAQDITFYQLSNVQVHDSLDQQCNCDCLDTCDACTGATGQVSCTHMNGSVMPYGTFMGACLGSDDYVTVSFSFDLKVKSSTYDVGLYVPVE
mmetsp:Transcript_11859/g.25269  ORF Transcript_11859/g.25269 Transcript_11859/m.25269 type:complete len:129 (-) Transcript_11859:721-1107(-)